VTKVGVRLNLPNPAMLTSRFEVMSGETSKFGIGWDNFIEFINNSGNYRGLSINGLHVYFGSQLLDEAIIASNFRAISEAALTINKILPLDYINYGGGFGVPYEENEKPLDISKLAECLKEDALTDEVHKLGIRANLELGRFLVAKAGIYTCTVVDIKYSNGIIFVILDGGIQSFFRPKFTGQTHRVTVLGRAGNQKKVRLVGNTCTPLDVFYSEIVIPMPEMGDVLVFENAGAYGYSMSLLDFISFDKPIQIMEGFL
jgi:diaminopimelate decarboxylase